MPRAFGEVLKELRAQAGLSQLALAKKAGLSQRAISNIEQELRSPNWDTVLAISKALGVSCEAFQSPAKPKSKPK
jgi:transcriptional regulator with XRE-family HTH domain